MRVGQRNARAHLQLRIPTPFELRRAARVTRELRKRALRQRIQVRRVRLKQRVIGDHKRVQRALARAVHDLRIRFAAHRTQAQRVHRPVMLRAQLERQVLLRPDRPQLRLRIPYAAELQRTRARKAHKAACCRRDTAHCAAQGSALPVRRSIDRRRPVGHLAHKAGSTLRCGAPPQLRQRGRVRLRVVLKGVAQHHGDAVRTAQTKACLLLQLHGALHLKHAQRAPENAIAIAHAQPWHQRRTDQLLRAQQTAARAPLPCVVVQIQHDAGGKHVAGADRAVRALLNRQFNGAAAIQRNRRAASEYDLAAEAYLPRRRTDQLLPLRHCAHLSIHSISTSVHTGVPPSMRSMPTARSVQQQSISRAPPAAGSGYFA